jgi:hypothetical protein
MLIPSYDVYNLIFLCQLQRALINNKQKIDMGLARAPPELPAAHPCLYSNLFAGL